MGVKFNFYLTHDCKNKLKRSLLLEETPITYVHPYLHTYLLNYLLTYLLTYILTYLLTYMHTYIQPNLNTYLQVQIGLTITSFIFGALQVQEKLNGDCFILWISGSSAIVTKWKNSRPWRAQPSQLQRKQPKRSRKHPKKTASSKENSFSKIFFV